MKVVITPPPCKSGGIGGGGGAVWGVGGAAVEVVPFRRICVSDRDPVSMLTFVFPREGVGSGTQDGNEKQEDNEACSDLVSGGYTRVKIKS